MFFKTGILKAGIWLGAFNWLLKKSDFKINTFFINVICFYLWGTGKLEVNFGVAIVLDWPVELVAVWRDGATVEEACDEKTVETFILLKLFAWLILLAGWMGCLKTA